MPETHTILISAVPADAHLADRLEQALQARGLVVRRAPEQGVPAGASSKAERDAYGALLLVLSPEAATAETTLRAYRQARAHGTAIIPVLARPTANLSDEFRELQWIDYSGSAERGWSSVLVALNALGLLPVTSGAPPRFDAELALARAQHGLTPPTWRVYRPMPGYYVRASGTPLVLFVLVLFLGGPFLFTIAELLTLPLGDEPATLTGAIGWILVGAVSAILAVRVVRLRWQQRRSVLRPELLVLTPEGFVLRRFSGTMVCQFADTAELSMRTTPLRATTTVVMTARDGRAARSAALDFRFGVPAVLARQIIELFAAYQRRYREGQPVSREAASPALFISYARKNSQFADALEYNLHVRGLGVWMDRSRLVGGQEWSAAIRQAIETCAALLVIVTPQALASEVVRREYEYARDLGKPIVPLLFRAVASLPEALRECAVIDCRTRDGSLRGDRELTLALDTLGIRPLSPPGPPRMDLMLALARGDAGHVPADWHVYRSTAPRWARWVWLPILSVVTLGCLVAAATLVYNLLFRFTWTNGGGVAIGLLGSTAAALTLLPLVWVVGVYLVRRPLSTLIVLTPNGVAVRAYGAAYAVQYCDLSGVRLGHSGQRGRMTRMEFLPRGGQKAMTLSLFRTDAPPNAIAHLIEADFARYVTARRTAEERWQAHIPQ